MTPSTRAATFTGSPITVNSSFSPPPIVPAITLPELMPTPIADAAAAVPSAASASSAAAASARSAWSRSFTGAPNTPEHPVADELVRVAAVLRQDRHDELEELVHVRHHLARAGVLGEAREVAQVDEDDGDLHLLALQARALLEHPRGHLRVHVAAERVVQRLPLREAADHLVEAERERSELVARGHGHAHRVVGAA